MSLDDEILREMAKLTLISGKINPIQEKNLKMYGLLFFEGVSSASIEYDLSSNPKVEYQQDHNNLKTSFEIENKGKPTVKYFITLDESQTNDSLDKRFKFLETCVRKIFWNDTKVMIYFNNRLVFESDKNV